jgi:hypothetical protein
MAARFHSTPSQAVLAAVSTLAVVSVTCRYASNPQAEADLIRATERQRLRALVEANMDVAGQLHADDFQLINPFGGTLSREQYLGAVAAGEIDYLVWEPESPIAVRVYGQAAVIRYQSQVEIVVGGQKIPLPAVLAHRLL